MHPILERLSLIGIIPVIKLDDPADALPLARALCDGGLACAEITFRTDAAEESIRTIAANLPDMMVGAGTVLTTEQVDQAAGAGAKFIVSPGFNPKIVEYCLSKGLVVVPGCSTPSDVEAALELGLDVVKFFPAEAAGGLPMIKAMSAPYTGVRFIPTGGVHAGNLTAYLDFDKILACGGSWMVKHEYVKTKDWAKITALTKEAVSSMLDFRMKHVGVNAPDPREAEAVADAFDDAFGLAKMDGPGGISFFSGGGIEIMKNGGRGTNGHIAISTNYVGRAVYYLGLAGYSFDMDTARYDDKGQLSFVYLEEEIGGFAVHLTRR